MSLLRSVVTLDGSSSCTLSLSSLDFRACVPAQVLIFPDTASQYPQLFTTACEHFLPRLTAQTSPKAPVAESARAFSSCYLPSTQKVHLSKQVREAH